MQRQAVVTPALPGWFRSIFEYMSLVAAAAGAMVLGAREQRFPVAFAAGASLYGLVKAGPAGTAVELGFGEAQWQVTGGADIGSLAFLVVQRATPGALGGFLEQYLVLRLGQKFLPVFFG